MVGAAAAERATTREAGSVGVATKADAVATKAASRSSFIFCDRLSELPKNHENVTVLFLV